MVRDKVNSLFNNRIFRLIFSLLVAIALWIYVEYTENEDIQSGGIRVAVEFLNPELVTDRNLIITEKLTKNITLEFSGKRSNVGKLRSNGAIHIIADLDDVTSAGLNVLHYTVTYGPGIDQSGLSIISRSEDYVLVNVETAKKTEIPIVTKVDGQIAADGYQAEAPIFSPEKITISGPRSEVDRVEAARVNIRRENLTKTVTSEMEFTLIDEDGNEIKSELITPDRDVVTVTIPIRMIKDVALAINLLPGAGATSENTIYTIEPAMITLSGEPEDLSMNSIALATIDLTLFESYHTGKYQIILPNTITNVTGITEAEVTISIKGLETKNFTVPLQNVQFTNETPGYETTSITTELEVKVRGTAEELALITEDNIRIIVDMTEFGDTIGAFSQPARIRIDSSTPTSCGAIGEYKVYVRVTPEDSSS